MMPDFIETPAAGLKGLWRDVLRDGAGRIVEEGPVRANAIVADCRRALALFVSGAGGPGIEGLWFGQGEADWDVNGTPAATPAQAQLVDPHPFLLPAAQLQIDFVDEMGAVTAGPTNRLQIVANLPAGSPPWPDANHTTLSLREFGLATHLAANPALFNYVTHPVINKDAASSLERTIWLVF
ncbi:hypothetical protein ACUSIJ_22665 [Pseudochelatococcus sp. B33]